MSGRSKRIGMMRRVVVSDSADGLTDAGKHGTVSLKRIRGCHGRCQYYPRVDRVEDTSRTQVIIDADWSVWVVPLEFLTLEAEFEADQDAPVAGAVQAQVLTSETPEPQHPWVVVGEDAIVCITSETEQTMGFTWADIMRRRGFTTGYQRYYVIEGKPEQ